MPLRKSTVRTDRPPLQVGDIELDRAIGVVRRFGTERPLRLAEFRILELLMERPGAVFSRPQILNHAWNGCDEVDDRTVDVEIGRLRKRINRTGSPDPIRSVRGRGYKFDEDFATRCHADRGKVRLSPLTNTSRRGK